MSIPFSRSLRTTRPSPLRMKNALWTCVRNQVQVWNSRFRRWPKQPGTYSRYRPARHHQHHTAVFRLDVACVEANHACRNGERPDAHYKSHKGSFEDTLFNDQTRVRSIIVCSLGIEVRTDVTKRRPLLPRDVFDVGERVAHHHSANSDTVNVV